MFINFWPFSIINQLKELGEGYHNDNKVLSSRVHDLERQVEMMTGANQILTSELDYSKRDNEMLLSKIFDFTGLNNKEKVRIEIPQQPINIGSGKKSWPAIKENLEIKARADYWEKKKAESENKPNDTINELEKEVLG